MKYLVVWLWLCLIALSADAQANAVPAERADFAMKRPHKGLVFWGIACINNQGKIQSSTYCQNTDLELDIRSFSDVLPADFQELSIECGRIFAGSEIFWGDDPKASTVDSTHMNSIPITEMVLDTGKCQQLAEKVLHMDPAERQRRYKECGQLTQQVFHRCFIISRADENGLTNVGYLFYTPVSRLIKKDATKGTQSGGSLYALNSVCVGADGNPYPVSNCPEAEALRIEH